MYVISYCALGLLALMMVGLVAYDALTRLWRERPKRLWECVVVLVFAAGMLESMAVKPGSRGMASAPAAHSATDGIVSRQSDSSGVSTNAVPSWEVGLAFRSFVWTPSNVVAELAWPSGFFAAPVMLDVLAAFHAITNDWRWIGSESVPSGATNLVFAVSAADLDLSAMPEALFLRAAERIGFNSNMDDFDGDGLNRLSAAVCLYDSSSRTEQVSFENETNGYSRCGYRLDGVYSASTDSDGDGLINLHEYWAGTNPLVPDGSNTLLSVMSRSVDDRLTADPTGRIGKFRPEAYGLLLNTNYEEYLGWGRYLPVLALNKGR